MEPPPSRQNQIPASANAAAHESPLHDPDCIFCQIITTYPIIDPVDPSFPRSPDLGPERLMPPAFVLLSTPHVVAFLDIYPLTRGHVLVCPRRHAEKVGDLTPDEGAEIGRILPLVSRAVCRATMPEIPHAEVDYNVVQNNGPGAAQVVPHTHFHIVPRYPFNSTYTPFGSPTTSNRHSPSSPSSAQQNQHRRTPIPQGMKATAILFGRGQRHYRDDDDAVGLVELMRREVAAEWAGTFGRIPQRAREASREAGAEEGQVDDAGNVGGEGGGGTETGSRTETGTWGRKKVMVGTVREGNLPILETTGREGSRGKGGRL